MGFSRQEYWSGLALPSPDIKTGATEIQGIWGDQWTIMNNYTPTNLTLRRNGQISRNIQNIEPTKIESRRNRWHFPGDPVVKTSPSNAGVVGQSLIWELRSHMPHVKKTQNIKQKQYCKRLNKNFKNAPNQTNLLKSYIN